ncbi:MAG TPA: hypothetical protein VI643_05030 [Planctomycetota bacterium]|nr:hypothetical protein [Planctomycetota bacterium]
MIDADVEHREGDYLVLGARLAAPLTLEIAEGRILMAPGRDIILISALRRLDISSGIVTAQELAPIRVILGRVDAEGTVYLKRDALAAPLASAINWKGMVEADRASIRDSQVRLSAAELD